MDPSFCFYSVLLRNWLFRSLLFCLPIYGRFPVILISLSLPTLDYRKSGLLGFRTLKLRRYSFMSGRPRTRLVIGSILPLWFFIVSGGGWLPLFCVIFALNGTTPGLGATSGATYIDYIFFFYSDNARAARAAGVSYLRTFVSPFYFCIFLF